MFNFKKKRIQRYLDSKTNLDAFDLILCDYLNNTLIIENTITIPSKITAAADAIPKSKFSNARS